MTSNQNLASHLAKVLSPNWILQLAGHRANRQIQLNHYGDKPSLLSQLTGIDGEVLKSMAFGVTNKGNVMSYGISRISHTIILTSHNPYVAKARQNQRFDSVLFFFFSFEGVQSFAKQSFQRLRSQSL